MRKRPVRARTPAQDAYIRALKRHPLVFGTGPAGTGKTWLAVAHAVQMFERKEVDRIILSRPAVEAGERLGFLPGDMREKVDPYLRPVYDALYDLMDARIVERALQAGEFEIAPLAFMRGRTLSNAAVILDEAQNATSMQMKMFLTRLGENSRMIVTGDPSQVDLPPGQTSGLSEAVKLLDGIEGVGHVAFTHEDVIRHELVARIVEAYDRVSARGEQGMNDARDRRPHRLAAVGRRTAIRGDRARRHRRRGAAHRRRARRRDRRAACRRRGDARTQPRLARHRSADQRAVVSGRGRCRARLGDLAIAYETLARESAAGGTPFLHHLAHLAVHGFLHLLGYDHVADSDAETMEQLERDVLARIAIADPYRTHETGNA